MTAVSERSALRAIVLHTAEIPEQSTLRLLRDLGHEVEATASVDEALGMLDAGRTDLLVVDVPDEAQRRQVIHNLSTRRPDRRPQQVAVFAEALDEYVRSLRQTMERNKVHIFLKPLHVHGLLNILRSLEGRVSQPA